MSSGTQSYLDFCLPFDILLVRNADHRVNPGQHRTPPLTRSASSTLPDPHLPLRSSSTTNSRSLRSYGPSRSTSSRSQLCLNCLCCSVPGRRRQSRLIMLLRWVPTVHCISPTGFTGELCFFPFCLCQPLPMRQAVPFGFWSTFVYS